MWMEDYEKLNNSEKEEFKRLANLLLSKTFITRDYYDLKESMMKVNPEYRFIERHFELFSDYFFYSGWAVLKDNQYGVISMENIYEYNRLKLDRSTTLMLYTIRLIYEEEREKISLRNEIMTTTGQIIHKMITMNIFRKKPSDRDISESLRLLSNHNLIQKISGQWEDADTKIMILPSVLFVLTNEKISRIHELLGTEEPMNQDEQETEQVMDTLRGEVEE
ncbi:DUF4194 domain-containing protein [Pseudoclostridium thermosuccinogenes]|uniref:DUF4194 domain-containing protein n=1 Tax=Clostridium thermosuccinogenes TaxID=84032 RepID=UPI000CCC3D06|nr:DUF4194 domain-containing protein [Pseudoclostridium thermosuccinogenes]PNT90669.1 hypothetical protein CDQ83_18725 [Pseudoclostridium thermosuccinogenes]